MSLKQFFLFAGLFFLPPAIAAELHAINFPGKVSAISSPDGRYAIRSIEQNKEPFHKLVFEKKDGGGKLTKRDLMDYERNVDVLWSPDSSKFVVNDWLGSNCASAYLYDVRDLKKRIEIDQELIDSVKDEKDHKSLTASSHIYIFANRWISPGAIEIKATGHDGPDPGGFTLLYQWDLKSSFKRLKRLATEDAASSVPSNQ